MSHMVQALVSGRVLRPRGADLFERPHPSPRVTAKLLFWVSWEANGGPSPEQFC